MGNVYHGIPPQLMQEMQQRYGLDTFIETGTYTGDTTEYAARYFRHVYTVERDLSRFQSSLARLSHLDNVIAYNGDSPDILRRLVPVMRDKNRRCLYWLDAHYCGDGVGANFPQCPLMAELDAIGDAPGAILIDDARVFTGRPDAANDASQWPTFDQIEGKLRAMGRNVSVVDDVIIAEPDPISRNRLNCICKNELAFTIRE